MLNIKDVLRDVGFSARYWRELGERLKPNLDLDAIEANHSNVQRRLEDAVEKWLRDGDDPSWDTLAEAVTNCEEGGGKNVALKIRHKAGIGDDGVCMWLLPIIFTMYNIVFLQKIRSRRALEPSYSALMPVSTLLHSCSSWSSILHASSL